MFCPIITSQPSSLFTIIDFRIWTTLANHQVLNTYRSLKCRSLIYMQLYLSTIIIDRWSSIYLSKLQHLIVNIGPRWTLLGPNHPAMSSIGAKIAQISSRHGELYESNKISNTISTITNKIQVISNLCQIGRFGSLDL